MPAEFQGIVVHNEHSGERIVIPNIPSYVSRWKKLGYEIDTDEPIIHFAGGDEREWGKPNLWERNAPRDVHKLSGKR